MPKLRAFWLISLFEFVDSLPHKDPNLLDMLEKPLPTDEPEGDESYEEHLPLSTLLAGIKEGKYLQGSLQHSAYSRYNGTVVTRQPGALYSITVSGKYEMNRAMHGDIVAFQVITASDETDKKAEIEAVEGEEGLLAGEEALPGAEAEHEKGVRGKIVGIIRRSNKPIVGTIDRKNIKVGKNLAQSVLVIAMDRRFPRIRIRTRQAEALAGQRIVVTVDAWEIRSKYPNGHLIKVLGQAGDRLTETEAILLEHDVAHEPFVPSVLACLPLEDWIPTSEDYASRADFRELNICSVDPPGCTDIDDALHALKLPNGNFQVGVHIADVTHFVRLGSALDKEASSRATTVYLVDRRIDMLPGLLGTNLCSLKGNVERLAFSVLWEITAGCEIKSTQFTKSIISSKASFTYDQAQQRLDGLGPDDELTKSLKILNSLAKILKQRRIDTGALTLASPEVRFSLETETNNPVDVELKEMKAANSMVEEFMLLANIAVAEKLYATFPDISLLRRHPNPPQENFTALNKALEPFDIALLTDTSKQLAESLDKAVVEGEPFMNKLIRIMTTRCMLQAQYFASGTLTYENFWHYGLGLSDIYPLYFPNSPLR